MQAPDNIRSILVKISALATEFGVDKNKKTSEFLHKWQTYLNGNADKPSMSFGVGVENNVHFYCEIKGSDREYILVLELAITSESQSD